MKRQDHRERGAVLIVALLFLVMLTLLGVTAMTGTTMEERMAGNARDNSIAFQAAEAALRDAKRDLDNYPTGPRSPHPTRGLPVDWALDKTNFGNNFNNATCNPAANGQGLCLPTGYVGGENARLPPVAGWSFAVPPSVQYGQFTGAPQLQGVSRQPRYLIEIFCLVASTETFSATEPACNFFRVTAVGYGASPNTIVTLQEIVAKDPA